MSIPFEVKRSFQVTKEEAYRALLDLESADRWMQGLVRIERLDAGPLEEGSQWRETRKMFGKEATEHFEVAELAAPDKIVLRCDGTKGTTGKGEFIFTYLLSSRGDATDITMLGEIRGLTGMSKWLGKLMVGSFKKACTKDLDCLKDYLENTKAASR
jgi:uncharacterized protein YndB with AHSA1/START domain